MRSGERLAGGRREGKLTRERGELLDVGVKQEIDLQTEEGLQELQDMKRKEERPDEYPLMHAAVTRGV